MLIGFSCLCDLSCCALCGPHSPSGQYLEHFQATQTGSFISFPLMEIVGNLFARGSNKDEGNLTTLLVDQKSCGPQFLNLRFFLLCLPAPPSLFRRSKTTCLHPSAGKRRNICSCYIREKSQAAVNTTGPWLLTLLPGLR